MSSQNMQNEDPYDKKFLKYIHLILLITRLLSSTIASSQWRKDNAKLRIYGGGVPKNLLVSNFPKRDLH